MPFFLRSLIPFLVLGVMVVVLAFGFMLLAYLLLLGTLVGLIFYVVNWVRNKLFAKRNEIKPKPKSGRIIDSDDWRKL